MTKAPPVHTVPTAAVGSSHVLLKAIREALDGAGPVLPLAPNESHPASLADLSPFGPSGWLAAVPEQAAAIISTSGSTGSPKAVVLSTAALTASASATHDRLAGPGRWLLTLPIHHIAGFQVLVRSAVANTVPAELPEGPFTPESFIAGVASLQHVATSNRCDLPWYVSLVPTQLHRLFEHPAAREALTRFAAVLVGGSASAPGLLDRARDAGINVVETYGMTETAGGCIYDGAALAGVQWRLAEDDRIELAGPVLADGYLGRPELSAEAFPVVNGVRRFRTADLGAATTDEPPRLTVLGRADDMIITGGVNVSPTAVEQALLLDDAVTGAVVVGVPDQQWGQSVVALVTATAAIPGAVDAACSGAPAALTRRLRRSVTDQLGAAAAPKSVLIVAQLPQLASGKPSREAARNLAVQYFQRTAARRSTGRNRTG